MLRKATKKDRQILRQNFFTIYELPEFQYLYANGHSPLYELPPASEHEEIYVSVDNTGFIQGYFFAHVDRIYGYADEIVTINFFNKPSLSFSRDMLKFINMLIEDPLIERCMFHCIGSNDKAVSLDDRVIAKINGSHVGTLTNAAVLRDGSKHNVRIYEVLRENINDKGLKKSN